MPFFFDLTSLIPKIERNPFEPVIVRDAVPEVTLETDEEIPAEPIIDTGLPIPSHYDFDMMRAMVQDPFRLYVYWQLRENPFEKLKKIFPANSINTFKMVIKLVDESNNIAVINNAPYSREYWFSVFPDRTYRVEIGLRSEFYGYIKLLSSQPVTTPRGGPSDKIDEEPQYRIAADDYLRVLRESHLVPERAFTLDGMLPGGGDAPPEARNALWEALPPSFRRLMQAIGDIQSGREFDKWWDRLEQEELADIVREFLNTINQMGDGEMGYMLLLRYLPELLRRALQAEQPKSDKHELQIDKPIILYLSEKLGQNIMAGGSGSSENQPQGPGGEAGPAPGSVSHGQWLPSMKN